MRRLRQADLEAMRAERGRTALLFITDRCPVGCRHCSVDSRPDSPRVTDWDVFHEVVRALAALPVEAIAISGGEPFVERRALTHAVREIRASGKDVVVFTSGYWSREDGEPAPWIRELLPELSTVYLSTDSFHVESVARDRFRWAVDAVLDAGPALVVQVLDVGDAVAWVEELLVDRLGPDWPERVDRTITTPLAYGRGRDVFEVHHKAEVDRLGRCGLLGSPTVRYDGYVSPCCNEAVLMGAGPAALRPRATDADAIARLVQELPRRPLLEIMRRSGPGPLATGPGRVLAESRYRNVCEGCWAAVRLYEDSPGFARLVDTVASSLGNEASA